MNDRRENGIIPEREERGMVSIGSALGGLNVKSVDAVCQTHGPYDGSAVVIGGRSITSYCPGCLEDQRDRELADAEKDRLASIEQGRQRQFEERVATAGIPARFRDSSFDTYRIVDGSPEADSQARALRVCRAYADRWQSVREKGQVLVMTGSTGTGKTHLACAIGNQLMREHRISLAFGTVSDHALGVKATFQRDSGVSEREAIQALIHPDLLIMDELGQRTTEYDQQLMFNVVNARYNEMRPMVLMTNLSRQELSAELGDRLADRLNEVAAFVSFSWPSYRASQR